MNPRDLLLLTGFIAGILIGRDMPPLMAWWLCTAYALILARETVRWAIR